jgi:hypothetical protein
MTPAEVTALRQRLWVYGYRPIAIWNFDATIDDAGNGLNRPGKQPRGKWTQEATRNPPRAVVEPADPCALNTGALADRVGGRYRRSRRLAGFRDRETGVQQVRADLGQMRSGAKGAARLSARIPVLKGCYA